jgi:predicted nucleic acid-binding protein
MMVLVDTPVWSLVLRRRTSDLSREQEELKQALAELVSGGRAQLLGPVRQELLSGVREEAQFRRLRDHLRAFGDPELRTEDYEEAARMSNQCRSRGIASSAVDILICAVAWRRRWPILTTDRDYLLYSNLLPVDLYRPI